MPSAFIGVRSRLFSSGALRVIKPYKYNSSPASSVNDPTTGDCGPGFYNSHGFVRAFNGTTYQEFVTFPSDPLEFTAPAARGTNEQGESYGSGRMRRSMLSLTSYSPTVPMGNSVTCEPLTSRNLNSTSRRSRHWTR